MEEKLDMLACGTFIRYLNKPYKHIPPVWHGILEIYLDAGTLVHCCHPRRWKILLVTQINLPILAIQPAKNSVHHHAQAVRAFIPGMIFQSDIGKIQITQAAKPV
jgi:hypothetical protein